MLVACWSSKGGAGTSVVVAALGLLRAACDRGSTLLADLAGDLPAVLGAPDPVDPGLAGWLAAGADVPVDALSRLEHDVAPGLRLLARGEGPLEPERGEVLGALLGADARLVVADCGTAPSGRRAGRGRRRRPVDPRHPGLLRLPAAGDGGPGAALARRARRRARAVPHPPRRRDLPSGCRCWPWWRSTRRWPAPSTPACCPPACRGAWPGSCAMPSDAADGSSAVADEVHAALLDHDPRPGRRRGRGGARPSAAATRC